MKDIRKCAHWSDHASCSSNFFQTQRSGDGGDLPLDQLIPPLEEVDPADALAVPDEEDGNHEHIEIGLEVVQGSRYIWSRWRVISRKLRNRQEFEIGIFPVLHLVAFFANIGFFASCIFSAGNFFNRAICLRIFCSYFLHFLQLIILKYIINHDFSTRVYSALAAARKRRRRKRSALEAKDRIVNKNSSGDDSQLCGT